jgi:hypothetical protein
LIYKKQKFLKLLTVGEKGSTWRIEESRYGVEVGYGNGWDEKDLAQSEQEPKQRRGRISWTAGLTLVTIADPFQKQSAVFLPIAHSNFSAQWRGKSGLRYLIK